MFKRLFLIVDSVFIIVNIDVRIEEENTNGQWPGPDKITEW